MNNFHFYFDCSPVYMNYATMGWFIGHEITHGKTKITNMKKKHSELQWMFVCSHKKILTFFVFKVLTIKVDKWMQMVI